MQSTGREFKIDLAARARRFGLMLICGLWMVAPASACPVPPPAIRDLDLTRVYTDAAGSKSGPKLHDLHQAETAPIRQYLKTIVDEADASFVQRSDGLGVYRAKCGLEWLEAWAHGDALLGTMANKQASAERRWTLAGAALAYLKIKSAANAEQTQVIETWLSRLAVAAQLEFAAQGAKHNNHWYWLGLAFGATAMATSDEAMWQTARGIMQDAADAISVSGTLPLELVREARALHYHAFALMPLTAMAELARARGEDWYKLNDGALHRLVGATAKGIEDPLIFKTLSGFDQEQPLNIQYGWLALYQLERPRAFAEAPFEMPSSHAWLGGNVLLLNRALTK